MPGHAAPLRTSDPRKLGPYLLHGRLGQGGMGTVYLGRIGAGPWLAIKVIRDEYASDEDFRGRFRREAENARRVARFCTASVVDADPDGDPPYLVTEYVEGPTLSKAVATNGPLRSADLEQLAVNVATALTAIHNAGIVHRDLTPANVLLSPVGPKVIDFGVARATDLVTVVREAQRIGTPGFMSPEQVSGAPVGAAADIFAWGGIVVYAGSGRLPFGEGATDAVLYRVVNEEPRLEGLDGALRSLVEQAMRKDPAARPTAQSLLMRLVGEPMTITVLNPPGGAAPSVPHPSIPPTPAASPAPSGRRSRRSRREKRAAAAAQAAQLPAAQVPAAQVPAAQVPAAQMPVAQVPAAQAPAGKAPTAQRPAAQFPAAQFPAAPTRTGAAPPDQAVPARGPISAAKPAPAARPAPTPAAGSPAGPAPVPRPAPGAASAAGAPGAPGKRRNRRTVVLGGLLALAVAGTAGGVVLASGSGGSGSGSGSGGTATATDLVAVSRQLAADATAVRASNPALARRLSLAAFRAHETAEADRAVLVSFLPVTATKITMPTAVTQAVALGPDGRLMATAGTDHTVRLVTLADLTHPVTAATIGGFGAPVTAVAFSPDGRTLAAASADHTTRLFDVTDRSHPRAVATLLGHISPVEAVAFSPDGRLLATGADDRTARLWNISDRGRPVFVESLTGHYGFVTAVAFAAGGRIAVTAGIDGSARLWDVRDPKSPVQVSAIMGQAGAINSAAFSPDGQLLVTGGDDGTDRLIDITDPAHPRQVAQVTGHSGRVTAVAFAGSLLLTGSLDGTVTVHDVTDPRAPSLVATLPDSSRGVEALAVSGDASILASGDDDSAALVRTLRPATLASLACANPANRPDATLWRQYAPQVATPPAGC
jgi:hypothetical protein